MNRIKEDDKNRTKKQTNTHAGVEAFIQGPAMHDTTKRFILLLSRTAVSLVRIQRSTAVERMNDNLFIVKLVLIYCL